MEAKTRSGNRALDCYCIGSLHRALMQSSGKIGRVISAFERTLNVRTEQDELLVVTLDGTRSPASLNVRANTAHQGGFSDLVREGQDAVVMAERVSMKSRSMLQIGGISVSISAPEVFRNSLEEPVAGFLHTFAAGADGTFSDLAAGAEKRHGCLLNPDMTTEGLLAAFFDRLKTLRSSDYHSAVMEALVGLCGRGPGFTPAGDDFIAGYLAVSNWLNRALKLGPPMIPGGEFARLTTWTSFKLMEYSSRGLLDEQAQSMVNSVANGDIDGYIQCIKVISRRGHTSGIDFATGTAVGLCAAADRIFETGMLDLVSALLDRKPVQLS